jgi:OOP family OmpA-OmpF porin
MKKTMKLGLSVVALAVMSSAAVAANPGAYLGVGAGVSRLETPSFNSAGLSSYSQSRGGFGGRVFGGYNFNNYFGLEAGVADYANSTYKATITGVGTEKLTYSLYAASLVAKAYLPLSDTGFDLYALGGAAYVNSKVKDSQSGNAIPNVSSTSTTKKFRPTYGIGAGYNFNSNVSTTLELSRIQGTGNSASNPSKIPNADMLTLNVAYNFG